MKNYQRVLMTGVTGFVGKAFAKELLERYPHIQLWALARAGKNTPAAQRPELAALVANPRFHVLAGDVTQPGLGLTGDDVNAVAPGFDCCFHFAAETEFREALREQTFRVNLDGTRNLVAFCRQLPRLGKYYHVSTAYVCGNRQGVVKEELLPPAGSYFNAYEESKHAAESVVAASGFDWTILRLGILMGHSVTGEAESDKMTYGVFKTYWRLHEILKNKYTDAEMRELGKAPFAVAGIGDVPKNLICLDDVVRLILHTADKQPPEKTIFHITHPAPSAIGEMSCAMWNVLNVDYFTLVSEMPTELRSPERLIQRGIGIYRAYMTIHEPRFDQTALRGLIGDAAVDALMPMTPERLRFLFQRHLETRLTADVEVQHDDTTIRRLELVRKYGDTCMAYASLSNGTQALFLPNQRGYIAYAVKGRNAVMIGDPICRKSDYGLAAAAFVDYCRKCGLQTTGVQLSRLTGEAMLVHGGYLNRMGDEAIIDLTKFDLALPGKKYADLRASRNKAIKVGISVCESTYAEIPYAQVEEVSRSWLEKKINQRELATLLRPLPSVDEPDVRKFFAKSNDELVGVVVFNPQYADGNVIGYNADIERYMAKPSDIHDAMLLAAIKVFQTEGRQMLSLGLSPLAGLDQAEHPSHSPRTRNLLIRIRDEVNPVYNFKGVSHHKTFYCPDYVPTYVYTQNLNGANDVMDVFNLIGLMPPEALNVLTDDTFDLAKE